MLQHLDVFGGCGCKLTSAGSEIIKGTGSKARGISMETQPINVDDVRLVDLALSPIQRPASTIFSAQKASTEKRKETSRDHRPQRQFMTHSYITVSHSVEIGKSLQFIAELPSGPLSQGAASKDRENDKKPNLCCDQAFIFNANIHDCLKQPKLPSACSA